MQSKIFMMNYCRGLVQISLKPILPQLAKGGRYIILKEGVKYITWNFFFFIFFFFPEKDRSIMCDCRIVVGSACAWYTDGCEFKSHVG